MTLRVMTCIRGLRGIPPTPPLPPVPSRQDAVRTVRWRRRHLIAAGLDELSAHRLAGRTDVDIHAVLVLQDADFSLRFDHGDTSALTGVEGQGASRV